MQTQVFAIEDTKAESHLQPFFCENVPVALRLLKEPCNDPTHNFAKHATDYHLFKIGDWDPDLGVLAGHPKKHITCLEDLVEETMSPMTAIHGGE